MKYGNTGTYQSNIINIFCVAMRALGRFFRVASAPAHTYFWNTSGLSTAV
ncbi:MAG: hypothetical protein WCG25_06515 [bacterium]